MNENALPVQPLFVPTFLMDELERRIGSVLSGVQPAGLRAALAYGLEGGKRVRPLLTMLACEAAGGRARDALDAGVAIEFLHTASLFHDDIMDRASVRRGKAAVHTRFGLPTAILAGDTLIAQSFLLLAEIPSPRRVEVIQLFSRVFALLCEGQAHDLALDSGDHAAAPLHLEMVENKTAKLLEACTRLGALLAHAERPVVECLGSFGRLLGMAFQAKDDILDATSTEAEAGKSVGVDILNHKQTFLTIAYPDVDPVAFANAELVRYTSAACQMLELLPSSPARTLLAAQAHELTMRVR